MITDTRAPNHDDASNASGVLLRPGQNVWKICKADRAAVLVDAAAYYKAFRDSCKNAQETIVIAGWDIDSRTPLVGPSGKVDDGLPVHLGPFLTALVQKRPELRIKLLLWDYSVLYALERELLPALKLHWNTPRQIELCLDDETPFGASHHQKIAVIDNSLAFAGGLDLTIRRWDTPEHKPVHPFRVDHRDEAYPPFHDIQMMVEGEAANALGEVFSMRWQRSACEELSLHKPSVGESLWPSCVEPDFHNVSIGIARTAASAGDAPVIREVERLFEDMIGAAEREIYIENQFLTHSGLASSLARRLLKRPALQVIIVGPRTHHTWLEHRSMLAGRIRFMQILKDHGVNDRVRLVFPQVGGRAEAKADVMVHAKLMVVDDRILRVGSANLCRRSMGTDSECDLVIEATDEATRHGIRNIRNRLLAEHLGCTVDQIASSIERSSLIKSLDGLGKGRRRLLPIQDGALEQGEALTQIEVVADPPRPLGATMLLADFNPGHGVHSAMPLLTRIGLLLLPIVLFALVWQYTPLSAFMNPEVVSNSLQSAKGAWGPAMALGLFMVLGFLAFPLNVLIVATAAAFGLWPGVAYAAVGAMVSAFLTYLVGRRIGPVVLRRLIGPRINRISRTISANGVMAVTMVRLMPVAPFTFVNLVAGAVRIPLLDYMLGTALGLLPGLLLMTALGDRLLRMISDPSPSELMALLLVLAAWMGLSYGLQLLVGWLRRRNAGTAEAQN
ncbi:VTT domain-containing protein [Pseudoroseomonas globiformis]|uniref:Phospholipase D n=1 Tax=Teichococcus globiformis TaxID=2307229 RepID=A0ABV7FZM4_9PROT